MRSELRRHRCRRRQTKVTGLALAALVATVWASSAAAAAGQPGATYWLYVCAESDDIVEKITFDGSELRLVKSIAVGAWPTETEGPHGVNVSPDGEYWFLSLAHDQPGPTGSLHKYEAETDTWIDDVELGMFPATLDVSASIGLVYVVNFNLHGLPQPSTISVVDPGSMAEVGRIEVGVMPHGARMNRDGTRLYSVNMMDDVLVEVDTHRMEVSRRLPLSDHGRERLAGSTGGGPSIKPTWATPPTPQGKIYVAGNGAARILEVDVDDWRVTRTFDTPAGPYNLDVTSDGTLLAATYKSSESVGFWYLQSGEEVARVETLRPIPHGIVISPDDRFAFATLEGVGGAPGSVEAYDLETFERVSRLDVAKQAGGIALWKMQ